jgi:predicted permease
MKSVRAAWARIGAMFGTTRRDQELSAELESHLRLHEEDNLRAGMTPEEARRAAMIALGGVEQAKQMYRERRGVPWMESLWQDVRFSLRMLGKNPGFAAVAIATLALGVGVNTAIFSFVSAWLIQPLPYPHAEQLMVLSTHNEKQGWTFEGVPSSADYVNFAAQTTSFEQVVGSTGWDFSVTGDGAPEMVQGGRVSCNFFETLGVKPMLGRTFRASDDEPGAGRVAIISNGLWQSRYGGDRGILGKNIRISDESYAIVGVMPGSFQYPLMGIANLWTPLALSEQERVNHNNSWFAMFGRLKPGVSEAEAAAQTTATFERYARESPKTNTGITMLLSSMTYEIAREEGSRQVAVSLWVTAFILLIACANVASLMLANATRRAKEFAVRGAFGASRGRLVRQLLTESMLLFFFGAIAGTAFGYWGIQWIERAVPDSVRGYLVNFGQVSLDTNTLLFTLGVTLVCGLTFGVAPAFSSSKIDIFGTLKETASQASGSRKHARMRRIFVKSEIALAVVVLVVATLLVKSFTNTMWSNPGFNAANIMTAQLQLPATQYTDDARKRTFSEDSLAQIAALPGVESVGAASVLPFGIYGKSVKVKAAEKPAPPPNEEISAQFTAVSTNYLATMQIWVLQGRAFTSADGAGTEPVALIGKTLAARLWPNESPLRHQVEFGEAKTLCRVVGVVNDIKMYDLRERGLAEIYVPLAQFPSSTLGFAIRTAGDSKSMGTAVRDAIWAVDKDQPISSVKALPTLMADEQAGNGVLTKLMLFFGLLATFLGGIGIFGVMAQTVAQRTREIGIRMALGAVPRQAMGDVLVDGLRLTAVGVVIGILLAAATSRALSSILYNVNAMDVATFVGVPALFGIVALVGCYLPARRAMKVDPMVALRDG